MDENFNVFIHVMLFEILCYFTTFCKGQVAQQKEMNQIKSLISVSSLFYELYPK